MCYTLTSLSLMVAPIFNSEFPCSWQICPQLFAVGKAPYVPSFLSRQTSCSLSGLQPNEIHLSVSGIIQTNVVTSSSGKQMPSHPFVTTKPASHSPCCFTLLSRVTSMWLCMACGIILPQAVTSWD